MEFGLCLIGPTNITLLRLTFQERDTIIVPKEPLDQQQLMLGQLNIRHGELSSGPLPRVVWWAELNTRSSPPT